MLQTLPAGNFPAAGAAFSERRPLRLAYFVSHPIQYQAPLLRRLAQERDIDLKVFFRSDISVREYIDPGFGVAVKWDVPLLDGYQHEFLPVLKNSVKLGPWLPLNRGIRGVLRERSFDAVWVHGYSTSTTLQALLAARAMRLPVLLRAESHLSDRPRSRKTLLAKRLFFAWLRKRVAAVLAIGELNAAYWRHYLGEQFPIFPCSYAVDNGFFQRECSQAAATREQFRKSLDLEPERPIILYASKLQSRKRCIDLIDAYLEIEKSGEASRVPYLLIVGDGEERAALERRAGAARPGNIRFLGFRNQTELPRFFDLCNVFVLASVHEPWGLVVNEAMNAGRPVIVSDHVGCHANLVENGVNGFVVKAGDTGALAGALRDVLTGGAWRQMGAESLRIIAGHSFEENVRGIRRALEHVVAGFEAQPDGAGHELLARD